MNKKKLVFDVVFFSTNPNLIDYRLEKNSDFVSITLIITNKKNSEKLNNLSYNDRIQIIIDEEPFNNLEHYSEVIKKFVLTQYEEFDDIILISSEEEIPILSQEFLQNSKFKFEQFLYHDVYSFNMKHKSKFPEKGTLLVSVSTLMTQSNFLKMFSFIKKLKNFWIGEEQDGVILKDENDVDFFECPYSGLKIPYSDNTTTKKIFISFCETMSALSEDFDFIFKVKTKNSFPEKLYYTVSDKFIDGLEIFLPSEQLYQDANFEKTYLKNEVLRILNFLPKNEEDIVTIQFSENLIESYKIKELKNPS